MKLLAVIFEQPVAVGTIFNTISMAHAVSMFQCHRPLDSGEEDCLYGRGSHLGRATWMDQNSSEINKCVF